MTMPWPFRRLDLLVILHGDTSDMGTRELDGVVVSILRQVHVKQLDFGHLHLTLIRAYNKDFTAAKMMELLSANRTAEWLHLPESSVGADGHFNQDWGQDDLKRKFEHLKGLGIWATVESPTLTNLFVGLI